MEINKTKNVIDFYMLANNLKFYLTKDGKQSIADQTYGSMVLATAINSEYQKVENLGPIIRMILLNSMEMISSKRLNRVLANMYSGKVYAKELEECKNLETPNAKLVWDAILLEQTMSYLFDRLLQEEKIKTKDINELYQAARDLGITDRFGNNDDNNYQIFRFYYLNRKLKEKERSAWDKKHWNISSKRLERVSEHIVGTISLSTAFDSEYELSLNTDEINQTLATHEIGEIIIDDITPFDGITEEEKQKREHQAMRDVVGNLSARKQILKNLYEFDARKTKEASYAYKCDKLEADMQAKVYQDLGLQHPLTEQENNVVFKSPKIKEMIEQGAATAFDIWYEWDKDKYRDDEIFSSALQYIKKTKLR